MTRRPVAAAVAFLLWVVLALLWLVAAIVWELLFKGRFIRCPRYRKILAALPGRPRPVQRAQHRRRRMTSAEKTVRLVQLADRDGLWCQQCDRRLSLDVHHLADEHPEVHHLIAWAHCRDEPWANDLVNLALLCGPCNRSIGTGTTWRLQNLAVRLHDPERREWAA